MVDFEGSIVLEKLAEIGKVDEFYDAVDSDDFFKAQKLMEEAGIEYETISIVINKMRDSDGNH